MDGDHNYIWRRKLLIQDQQCDDLQVYMDQYPVYMNQSIYSGTCLFHDYNIVKNWVKLPYTFA